MKHLQQVLNPQQTYTTTLCSHINVIFSRIKKLKADIQKLIDKFTMKQDTVQIYAPDFNPDVDRPDTQQVHYTTAVVSNHELFTSPEPESVNATNTQEETTYRDQLDTGHSNSEDTHRPCNLSQQISDHSPEDNFTGQKVASTVHDVFHEIRQLEEEDWENDQFADADTNLINRHKTHSESDRIQKEFLRFLQKRDALVAKDGKSCESGEIGHSVSI